MARGISSSRHCPPPEHWLGTFQNSTADEWLYCAGYRQNSALKFIVGVCHCAVAVARSPLGNGWLASCRACDGRPLRF
jgi:hypothetical protein